MVKNMKLKWILPLFLVLTLLLCACGREEKPADTSATPETPLLPDQISDTTAAIPAPPTQPVATTAREDVETAPVDREPIHGEISSDSGTKLSLSMDWIAQPVSENRYRITAILYLNSYSIFVGERSDGELAVGSHRTTYHSDKIEYEDTRKTKIALTEYTFEHEFSGTESRALPVSASWHFGGVYAGTPVEWISLAGFIRIDQAAG